MNLRPFLLAAPFVAALSCAEVADDPSGLAGASVRVGEVHTASPIAAGDAHACLVANGAARCWGDNTWGQLGNGTTTDSLTPVDAWDGSAPLSRGPLYLRARMVGAGARHSCALRASGEVSCWGDNTWGQIGDGTSTRRTTPTAVPGMLDVTHLAVGARHACAALADGSVRCWGDNADAQLGQPVSLTLSRAPLVVAGLPRSLAVAAGEAHACAVLADGGVACWGDNHSAQLGERGGSVTRDPTPLRLSTLDDVVAVAAGGQHTCALRRDGAVFCWGGNAYGQLGDGTTTQRRTPQRVLAIGAARAITAGATHTCAALVDGSTWCWGSDASGALGSTAVSTQTATPVQSLGAAAVTALAAGASFTCAQRATGAVLCWGANAQGQLGDGTRVARGVPTTSTASRARPSAAIALGATHACAVRGEGRVTCWGSNYNGELGDGSSTPRATGDVYVDLGGVPATAVALGDGYSCALLADGSARCWGANQSGQLGDGSTQGRVTPVAVSGLHDAVALAAGGAWACALRAGGAVQCWGDNGDHQITNAAQARVLTPSTIDGFSDAVALGVGPKAGCVVRADGTLACWGGRVRCVSPGVCEYHTDAIATVMPGVSDAVDVALSLQSTMALRADGTLWCVEGNLDGACGLGHSNFVTSGAPVPGVTGATALSMGSRHGCALRVDGTLRCWGAGETGALGNGSFDSSPTATSLSLSSVVSVTAGLGSTCAVTTDAKVRCWGDNREGQLGVATPQFANVPTLSAVP